MANLRVTEIKAFVPAKNFDVSRRFYLDLGFTQASEGGGVAYFHFGQVSFLLQDFCADGLAENFMMHILVEDVDAWWAHVQASGVAAKYGVNIGPLESQPWGMRDFCLFDPSGVLWRIGQNTD
ncbi:MAG: VOC family protein [Rhodocyclaceae bacterium]|nr:VOC family protein [Rhodocyclaceae bacterium]MBX3666827.1 VOC family protein [Rhodocyclaceae bacterium]